ncbi:Putative uncharacterized protein C19orf29OS [Cyphomyrmex costatus]|uniref:Uncharacterized protein n=1 Tax=Cyphomyrmex costatus TaxID=456900 RepID=A0A195C0B5_9HYME|nr:Putative uncharacterized protein C19orf29OS [Cyphomyrmex costatus]
MCTVQNFIRKRTSLTIICLKKTQISYKKVFRRGIFVDEVRIENVEFISLYNFRRRIVHVVVCLIVFIPLEACVHAVEVARFTWSILVGP